MCKPVWATLIAIAFVVTACTTSNRIPEAAPTQHGTPAPATVTPIPSTEPPTQVVKGTGWKVTVQSVDKKYVPAPAIPNASKTRLTAIHLTITNTASTAQVLLPLAFHMQDHAGRQYTATPFGTLQPANGAIRPGGTINGSIVFDVPPADSGLTLVYLPSADAKPDIIPLD